MKRQRTKTDGKSGWYGILCCVLIGMLQITVCADMVEEDYTFTASEGTKTVHLMWDVDKVSTFCRDGDDVAIVKNAIRRALFDEGLFEDWVGTEALSGSDEFATRIKFIDQGIEKYAFTVHYKANDPFVVLCGRPEVDLASELTVMGQIADYWDVWTPEDLPVPRPGGVAYLTPIAPESAYRDVAVMEYINGAERNAYMEQLFKQGGRSWQDILKHIGRMESCSLFKIWRALGTQALDDLHSGNVLFLEQADGQKACRHIDLSTFRTVYQLNDYLIYIDARFRSSLAFYSPASEGFVSRIEVLLGIYDAMRQEGMSSSEIKSAFEGVVLSDYAAEKVAMLQLIELGMNVDWVDPEPGSVFPGSASELADEQRALQVALMKGRYGLYDELLQFCYPESYPAAEPSRIEAQYAFSTHNRDFFRVYLQREADSRPALIGIGHNREGGTGTVRAETEALRQVLVERGAIFLPRGALVKENVEFIAPGGTSKVRDFLVHRNWCNSQMAGVWLDEIAAAMEATDDSAALALLEAERDAVIRAQVWLFCGLYHSTLTPLTDQRLSRTYERCVLARPDRVLVRKMSDGVCHAVSTDLSNLMGPMSPGDFMDHYANSLPALVSSEAACKVFVATVCDAFGPEFVEKAFEDVTRTVLRNAIVAELAEVGASDDELTSFLKQEVGATGGKVYQHYLAEEYRNTLKGRIVSIEGQNFVLPNALLKDWTPADCRNWMAMIDKALGDEIAVPPTPSVSNEELADTISAFLKEDGAFTPYEWELFELLGVREGTADLATLLADGELLTSKGYQLTPRKLMMIWAIQGNPAHGLINRVLGAVKAEHDAGKFSPQPLEALMLTQSDYLALAELLAGHGVACTDSGGYLYLVNGVICTHTGGYLHEMTHALLANERYQFVVENNLRMQTFLQYQDAKFLEEGYVQERAARRLQILDDVLCDVVTGYKISGRDFGFFGVQKLAVNRYDDMSEEMAQWLLDHGQIFSYADYLEATEWYREMADTAAASGWSTEEGSFLQDYYFFCLKHGHINVAVFLQANLMPDRLAFDELGRVGVSYLSGEGVWITYDLTREMFRALQCNKQGVFVGPGGAVLDVSDPLRVVYRFGFTELELGYSCSLDVADMKSSLMMVQYESCVEAYYDGARVGRLDALLSTASHEVHIGALQLNMRNVDLMTPEELTRAMLLKRYKSWRCRGLRIEQFVIEPHLLDMAAYAAQTTPSESYPLHRAILSLIDDGYLADAGLNGDGHWALQVTELLRTGQYVINSLGQGGTLTLEGTAAAPTVKLTSGNRVVTLVDEGVFQGTRLEITGGGSRLLVEMPDGNQYEFSAELLRQMYVDQMGQEYMPLRFLASDNSQRLLELGEAQARLDGYVVATRALDVKMHPLVLSAAVDETADFGWVVECLGPGQDSGFWDDFFTQFDFDLKSETTFMVFEAKPNGELTSAINMQIGSTDWRVGMSWEALRERLPDGMVLKNEGEPIGYIKLMEKTGKCEVKGSMFLPERTAVMDLETVFGQFLDEARASGGLGSKMMGQLWVDVQHGRTIVVIKGAAVQKCNTKLNGLWTDMARADLVMEVSPDGSRIISASTHETISPYGLKKLTFKLGRAFCSAPGQAAFAGLGKGFLIYTKYNSDEYVCMDDLCGDVIGGAVCSGSWGVHTFLLSRLSSALLVKGMALGLSGGFVLSIPMAVVAESAEEFTRQFYLYWQAGEEIEGVSELTDLDQSYQTLCRAFLMTQHIITHDWLRLFNPLDISISRANLEDLLTTEHMQIWEATQEGQDASDDEYRKHEYAALNMAKLYGTAYTEMVGDTLMHGLSWITGLGIYKPDEFGFGRVYLGNYIGTYPLDEDDQFSGGGTAPVPAWTADTTDKDLVSVLQRKVYEFWRVLECGDGKGVDPVEELIGRKISLAEVLEWVVNDLIAADNAFSAHLDGSISSWPFGGCPVSLNGAERIMWNSDPYGRWLDCRTAISSIGVILDYMTEEQFLQSGYVDTGVVNAGFEASDTDEWNWIESISVSSPAHSWTDSDDQLLQGVRYQWDVRAHNEAGAGPVSEKRQFLVTE